MTVRVRPFADRDYVAFARIRSTGEQLPTTPEGAREADREWDARFQRVRLVAVDEEDAPLGYGEIYQEPARFEPDHYFLRLAVDLRMRRRGIGAMLWAELLKELEKREALGLYSWARDNTACAAFLARRGFVEKIRSYDQVRAVATAPVATPAAEERLAATGIRIATLADLMRTDQRALEKAHALYYESRLDQPTLGRVVPLPIEKWRANFIDDPDALLDSYFVAIDGDAYVGETFGHRTAAEDVLGIGVTSVLPSHRRRGIARALKLRLHAYARAKGYREIHTDTSRENKGMSALNDELGYVIVESIAGYQLTLTTRTSP